MNRVTKTIVTCIISAIVTIAIVVLISSQRTATAQGTRAAASCGRYQPIYANSGSPNNNLMILDTETGAVYEEVDEVGFLVNQWRKKIDQVRN
ncbi:MAG: hypothetical protein ACRENG_17510 [bacterium]